LVRSLASPGANLTGMSAMTSDTWEKRVELLDEIFPTVQRIGVLLNPLDSSNAAQLVYIRKGAEKLGKELMIVESRTPKEFAEAFARLKGMAGTGIAECRVHAISG
jgi:putative ABC transport system substrate-binding protein